MPRTRDTSAVWCIGVIGAALSAVPAVWLQQYVNFMMILGAVLVPVGGVLMAHYYLSRVSPAPGSPPFIAALYDASGPFCGASVAGLTAWGAGAAVYFVAGAIGGSLPAFAMSEGGRTRKRLVVRQAHHEESERYMKRLVCVLCLALIAAAGPRAQGNTRVVVLGTGTPNADPERFGPAVAVVVGETSYLVDFGVGVVRRAAAAERSGIRALGVTRLSRAFATHLHSDHTLGLADLILSPWVLERETPLEVYGPRGLRSMANHLVAAYGEDIRVRTTGGEPRHKYDPRIVNVREIVPGTVYRDERVTVTAFAVPHGVSQAFGYRFQTADRTIVVSGDTGADSRIEEQCRGCDVLVHEVYSEAGLPSRPPAWQAYHKRYHTSSRQLGAIAARAKPALLVLYHQLMWTSNEEELLKEVRSVYDGKVVSAHDLDVY